jgi:GAF domain-containing protein
LGGGSKSKRAQGKAGNTAGADSLTFEGEVCRLWLDLEGRLARPDHEGGGLEAVLQLIRDFSGLSWSFLTALIPADAKNYHIVAKSGDAPANLPSTLPLASGLAGWIHTKHNALALDKLKADGRHSYIFHKDEPIKGVRSCYGWPLLYNDQPRGGLIMAGRSGETLSPAQSAALTCLAARLAAQLQQDRLLVRVRDLSQLDSQTGLPHRGYFLDRLGRLIKQADLTGAGVELYVLATTGLGAFSCDNGQDAAGDLLRSVAGQLVEAAKSHWEIGHVSYGVFTLAVPVEDATEAKRVIARFKKQLLDWPLVERSGRAGLGLYPAAASYPQDADGPERLLELALTALAGDDENEEPA